MIRVRWIDRLVRRTVVVHLTTGASIRGVLVGAYRDSIVLSHATYLGMILREQVAWMQNLGESA
jgi:hypothetical protein